MSSGSGSMACTGPVGGTLPHSLNTPGRYVAWQSGKMNLFGLTWTCLPAK